MNKQNNELTEFISIVNQRTNENKKSFEVLYQNQLFGNCFSILRQELDSMVRIIYLLNLPDLNERNNLIKSTLNGNKWRIKNANGKWVNVTDKEMAELSNSLNGWTLSVYKFGCAFIHLSDYHNYHAKDPFQSLAREEKENIIKHMSYYHGAILNLDSTFKEIIPYLGNVLEKITDNLDCYIKELTLQKIGINDE
jgi:hypothetical protein